MLHADVSFHRGHPDFAGLSRFTRSMHASIPSGNITLILLIGIIDEVADNTQYKAHWGAAVETLRSMHDNIQLHFYTFEKVNDGKVGEWTCH